MNRTAEPVSPTTLPLPQDSPRRRWQALAHAYGMDALIGLVLIGIAWAIARQYAQPSLFIWGDHPGQFMRMWYPLVESLPRRGLVVDWNPTWYAGYPELQFYPPGSVMLGLLLNLITLGQLTPEQVYNLVPALAFVLPLFTCFIFLRETLAPLGRCQSRVAGLAAGLLSVCFAPMWGGIDGVVIGLMGERLAFGLAPLGLLVGWRVVERPGPGRLAWAAVVLAVLLLLHPFHAPGVVLAVAAYALIRSQMRSAHPRVSVSALILWLGGWLLLSIGLIAWWVAPLLVCYTPYAASLVRARPDQVLSWFDAATVPELWLAGLAALLLLLHDHARVRGTVSALLALIPLILGGIVLNDRVLLGMLGWSVLDPIRFIAEYYLALILLAGCAVGAVAARSLWRIVPAGLAALLLVAVSLTPILPRLWRNLQDHATVPEPYRLETLLQMPVFDGYWDALRQDAATGRVLFLANYLRLSLPDGTVLPTSLQSLTPYLTGREIVGGTFSHWSPVARWLWVGDPWAEALPAQMEAEDDRRLFGIPWEAMDDADLAERLRGLHVTTVVAGPANPQARAVLDASPRFVRAWDNGSFTIYHLAEPSNGWVEATGAAVRLVERTPRRWVVAVDEQTPGATVTLKMGHYPLWRARAAGQTLPVAPTAQGLQQITLPPGAPYTLEIVYQEGWLEWVSGAVSIGCVVLAALLIWSPGRWGFKPSRSAQRL